MSLSEALQRPLEPARFVVSMNLGDPPDLARLEQMLAQYPETRLKLDATPPWPAEMLHDVAALRAVEVVDFKAHHGDLPVPMRAGEVSAAEVAAALVAAWLEDPSYEEATGVLSGEQTRITWDAPITSVDSIVQLPFTPRMVNLKPSRFGRLEELFDAFDHCRDNGIAMYGGGQFELGIGRQHIQYLAAMLHPDAPNDVAPSGNHELARDLSSSLLHVAPAPVGFA